MPLRSILLALVVATLSACATTGATFRSGVGDAYPDSPPYYAGASETVVFTDSTRIGHLPIAYQRGATQAPIFDPNGDAGSPVAALLSEMNAYLDSLARDYGVSVKLAGPAAEAARRATAPDVQFGCLTPSSTSNECQSFTTGGLSTLGRSSDAMRLAVGRPSKDWTAQTAEAMRAAGVGRVLVIALETGQYRMRQENWRGDKKVALGTGHSAALPWLTSLDKPVSVLQLTGALMDSTGQAIRIGAEGIRAVRTGMVAAALGAEEVVGDATVAEVRTQRREDLPGQPLAWREALKQLVAGLTGRPELARMR